jgi:hypothetical protein
VFFKKLIAFILSVFNRKQESIEHQEIGKTAPAADPPSSDKLPQVDP